MRKFIKKILLACLLFTILFIPNLYAKDLVYQADISDVIRYTTFVKAYREGTESDHTTDQVLSERTGGSEWYQTKYITFHTAYGSHYTNLNANDVKEWDITNTKADDGIVQQFVYYDKPKDGVSVINSQNYEDYDNIIEKAAVYIKKIDGSATMGQLYSTWWELNAPDAPYKFEPKLSKEKGEYAVEEKSVYHEPWMRVSTFRIPEIQTNRIKYILEENYKNNSLETQIENNTVYAKVRLTNVLTMNENRNDNIYSMYKFIYEVNGIGQKGWNTRNYGYVKEEDGTYKYLSGQSALNNFDNILLIPFKEIKDREVYVTYQILGDSTKDGIFWNDGKREQELKSEDGKNTVATLYNEIPINEGPWFEDNYYLEHYTLKDGQKNLYLGYNENICNKEYEGVKYKYCGMRVVTGEYDSRIVQQDGDYVGNDLENKAPIKVTFYYEPISDKDQYVYVKHVNTKTGSVISELKKSEDVSDNFNESRSVPSDFQSAYTLKADGLKTGEIHNQNKVKAGTNVNINGTSYKYDGYRSFTSSDENSAINTVGNTYLKPSSGTKINASRTVQYTTIVFYYTPIGNVELKNELKDVELVGTLDFINTGTYKGITGADIVPATVDNGSEEWLCPYVNGAYPYIVRAMKYSSTTEDKDTVEPVITIKKRYYYTTTEETENGTVTNVHSGFMSTDYKYTMNIKHTYYKIDNFKMYKIKNLVVNDIRDVDEYGGYLFKDSTDNSHVYNISTSNLYESRFNDGKQDQPYNVEYEDKSFTLDGGETASSESEAQNKTDAVGIDKACTLVDLDIKITYGNQYISLDNKTDMLDENLNSDTFTIKAAESSVTVDATKDCSYTENLDKYMRPTNTTTYEDFNYEDTKNQLKISNIGDNGIRLPSGQVNYTIVGTKDDKKFNIGDDNFDSRDYTYEINSIDTAKVKEDNLDPIYKTFNADEKYANDENATKEVRQVDILTPLRFNTDYNMLGESYQNVVDMSLGETKKLILQQGKKFTIKPSMATHDSFEGLTYDVNKFVKYYYVICDFETNGNKPFHPYKVMNDTSVPEISLTPTSVVNNEAVSNTNNNIYIIAIAKNATQKINDKLTGLINNLTNLEKETDVIERKSEAEKCIKKAKDTLTGFIGESTNTKVNISEEESQSKNNLLSFKRLGASKHVIMRTINTSIINRIYDFEITDCTDLSFKNVFRDNSNSSNVNKGTDQVYYSGTKELIVAQDQTQIMSDRIDLGEPKTILPLGPYKNTNGTYIFAPKLGYRFSFDLKTTGYLNEDDLKDDEDNNDRFIGIVPRYFYVSKSGEYKENITLYYKDSSGKYKQITKYIPTPTEGTYDVQSGGNYNIYFKPDDGYRYLRGDYSSIKYVKDYMSNKLEAISVSKSGLNTTLKCSDANYSTQFPIKLTKKMMTLDYTNSGFIQTWYGEFKLPNSTIAVNNDDTNSNINNPLKNGYIGVIFDIYCIDQAAIPKTVLYYSKNDKNASSNNTSQWDYEGFLDFQTPGRNANVSLQLEKGRWIIDNDTYNKIKGTVILYDTDNRAANDFN